MNTKKEEQDCKKCIWYESCKENGSLCRCCKDYDSLDGCRQAIDQYINDLEDRQSAYMKIMQEFTD